MKNKVFISIFFIMIFFVFFWVGIKEVAIRMNIVKFYKTDNWEIVEKSSDPIYDKIMSAEAFIKNRYNNYFPLYNKINSLFYNSNIFVDSLYLNEVYLKDNNDDERLFYNSKDDFYYLVNKYSDEELDKRLEKQANFYNEINDKYPEVELLLYIPLRYETTSFMNINNNYNKVNTFTKKLNSGIKYKLQENKTLEEYLKHYYKSDHHYNSYGAEIAYKDVLKMYNIQSDLEIQHKEIKNPFYGSMAKSTLLTRTGDVLTAISYTDKPKTNIVDENFKPLSIENKENPFYDYYVKYFNGTYDEIIYNNDSNLGRNLLIIGDSMSWQIDYLLAHSFDKTYVVNTKYGKWKNNNLILKDYIKQNNITHILFFREAKNLVFDADNLKVDEKVVR